MWQETKHGLYKKFVFSDFRTAWTFMEKVSAIFQQMGVYPRWQNVWNVVEFWIDHSSPISDISPEPSLAIEAEIDGLYTEMRYGENSNVVNNDDKNTTKITEVQLYADGGSRGNPGPSASGYVVLDMSGKQLFAEGIYLGITTNNQAEYQALKLGLEKVLDSFGARNVHVYMDSLLVINQMKKVFKVRNRDLWPVHDAVVELSRKFSIITFDHIPRELNKMADAEVNKCLDAEQNK